MQTVTIPLLGWTLPRLALELALASLLALGVALVVTAVRGWRDLRADERAWRADPDAAGWDDYDQQAALMIAAEERWQRELAEIRAEAVSIDQWRDAGYPASRVPYAIVAAAERREQARDQRRLDALIGAEMLVRLTRL